MPRVTAALRRYQRGPTRAESPLRNAFPTFHIASAQSLYVHGWAQHIDISADHNQFDVTGIWVEPDWAADDAFLLMRLHRKGSSKVLAVITVPGYPSVGQQLPTFLDPPEVQASDVTVAIGDPFAWQLHDSTPTFTGVDVAYRGVIYWRLWTGRNGTAVKFPTPPTGVDLSQVLPASPVCYAWIADIAESGPVRLSYSADYYLAY
jgi:hypothetical protein